MVELSKKLLKRLLDVEKMKYCQECGTCSASCPVAKVIPESHNPRVLLQKILLSLSSIYDLKQVLTNQALWLCAWCYSCSERCPQGMKPTEIFLLIRNLAVEQGYLPKRPTALVIEALTRGRTLEVTPARLKRRESLGLPKIGQTISERALDEIKKITEKSYLHSSHLTRRYTE